ncbi:MAG: YdeI/OmpD-associated family protein [Bacteroidota bacterium]
MKKDHIKPQTEVFYPKTAAAWRKWLQKNHESKSSVWLVSHNKSSDKPTISWTDSVDVALCFGWIDSKKIKVDSETAHQFFSKRKDKGTWSKINKAKVEKLIESGLMTEAGLKSIETAKANGSWTILDEVEELLVPKDLETALLSFQGATDYFLNLSKSTRQAMLQWIVLAKRPETRTIRINEIAELASLGKKPKQF